MFKARLRVKHIDYICASSACLTHHLRIKRNIKCNLLITVKCKRNAKTLDATECGAKKDAKTLDATNPFLTEKCFKK